MIEDNNLTILISTICQPLNSAGFWIPQAQLFVLSAPITV